MNSVFSCISRSAGHRLSRVRHGLGLTGECGADCLHPMGRLHRGSCLGHHLEGKKVTSSRGGWDSAVFMSPLKRRRMRLKHGKACR